METLAAATILAALVLLASMASVELGISVAIIEIGLGVFAGNVLGVTSTPWIDFLAAFAGIVLTFLAGAEVDPGLFRQRFRESVVIGGLSFAVPFAAAGLFAYVVAGWDIRQSEIAGIALSTTSLAVVYAVLVETGLTKPEIKGAFLAIFILMWTADLAKSQAVLPAFLLGLAVARVFRTHREQQKRFRVVAFSLLTPFFFLKGGMNVSLGALAGALPLLAAFFVVKIAAKFVGVYPASLLWLRPHAIYTTLLMSTGLTFGTISSLYGLNAGIIDRTQFSVLITTVILSAIAPTFLAQRFFSPPLNLLTTEQREAIEDEEFAPRHPQ